MVKQTFYFSMLVDTILVFLETQLKPSTNIRHSNNKDNYCCNKKTISCSLLFYVSTLKTTQESINLVVPPSFGYLKTSRRLYFAIRKYPFGTCHLCYKAKQPCFLMEKHSFHDDDDADDDDADDVTSGFSHRKRRYHYHYCVNYHCLYLICLPHLGACCEEWNL